MQAMLVRPNLWSRPMVLLLLLLPLLVMLVLLVLVYHGG